LPKKGIALTANEIELKIYEAKTYSANLIELVNEIKIYQRP